jgi:hypothetical protein
VIVLPWVQTFNGGQTPGVRIKNVTLEGFEICILEIVGGGIVADGVHNDETMGWLAIGYTGNDGGPVA